MVVEIPAIDELRRDYRLTYAEYARRVDALEQLRQADRPDSRVVEDAILAIEMARHAHSAARDRLAERLGAVVVMPRQAPPAALLRS